MIAPNIMRKLRMRGAITKIVILRQVKCHARRPLEPGLIAVIRRLGSYAG